LKGSSLERSTVKNVEKRYLASWKFFFLSLFGVHNKLPYLPANFQEKNFLGGAFYKGK